MFGVLCLDMIRLRLVHCNLCAISAISDLLVIYDFFLKFIYNPLF